LIKEKDMRKILEFISVLLPLMFVVLYFGFPKSEAADKNKLGWMEKRGLKNRLVELYKTGGSEKEIREVRETLMENGLSARELEREQLIFSVSTDYAEKLVLN
jgi:hypothetical protein